MKKITRKNLSISLVEILMINKDIAVLMGKCSLGHVIRDVQMD